MPNKHTNTNVPHFLLNFCFIKIRHEVFAILILPHDLDAPNVIFLSPALQDLLWLISTTIKISDVDNGKLLNVHFQSSIKLYLTQEKEIDNILFFLCIKIMLITIAQPLLLQV